MGGSILTRGRLRRCAGAGAIVLISATVSTTLGTSGAQATTSVAAVRAPLVPIVAAPGNGTTTSVGTPPPGPSAAAVPISSIQVTYTGFTTAARAAFQAAVNYWAATVSTSVPIKITATFKDLGRNANGNLILGSAGPYDLLRDFPHAPIANTWYPDALANRLAGTDLEPANPDIVANFTSNAAAGWYFGTNNITPSTLTNFESVVLHELGHGLGFLGSMTRNNTTGAGSYGFGLSPAYPAIYDRFAINGANTALLSFASGSVALGDQLINGNGFWRGGAAPKSKLYEPSPFLSGSSYSHLDETTFPRGNANSLMTPQIAPGEGIATAGPIALNMFRAMGWAAPIGTAAHDLTGDRNNDLIARSTSGTLYTYPGNGAGAFLPNFTLGTGFNFFNTMLVTRDWNGDGTADLIGRAASTGALYLYAGTGNGGYASPVQIGTGWNGFNALLAPGDFNGDGKSDLIARKPDGTLWLYRGNGTGGFLGSAQIGTGWSIFNALVAPGDFNGDAKSDLIGRKADGTLWLYRGSGTGGFISAVQNGSGWNGMNLIA